MPLPVSLPASRQLASRRSPSPRVPWQGSKRCCAGAIPTAAWCPRRYSCAQARIWRDHGLPRLRIGVNVSALQFDSGRLVGLVSEPPASNSLPADCLALEITEGTLMTDVKAGILTMEELRRLGVHIAIDDFGTGYSSLSYLKNFPINDLKIDQSFLRDLQTGAEDRAIVRGIIAPGHSLQLNVIAEGVETAEQQAFLAQAGCDEMQGYYVSRLLAADPLADFLREQQGRTLAAAPQPR